MILFFIINFCASIIVMVSVFPGLLDRLFSDDADVEDIIFCYFMLFALQLVWFIFAIAAPFTILIIYSSEKNKKEVWSHWNDSFPWKYLKTTK